MQHEHLIIEFRQVLYAIDAALVREIVRLPSLTPLDEAPPYVIGAFNLRGDFIPVIDLGQRFAEAPASRLPSDQVVVIEHAGLRIGLLVNDLHDVASLDMASLDPASNYALPGGQRVFVSGVLKHEGDLIMQLDCTALLRAAPVTPTPEPLPAGDLPPAPDLPLAGVSASMSREEETELFRQRATELARLNTPITGTRSDHALIRLAGEAFGLDIRAILEFTRRREVAPIPCTPAHIAGCMNLRGDLLTLIDIRPLLGLSTDKPAEEVIVLQRADLRLGLIAEAIEDVVSLTQDQLSPAPTVTGTAERGWSSGIGQVDETIFSLIDLDTVLASLRQSMTAGP